MRADSEPRISYVTLDHPLAFLLMYFIYRGLKYVY
jgi:hypothetical protein